MQQIKNNVENVCLYSQQIVEHFEWFTFYCNQLKCILFAEYNSYFKNVCIQLFIRVLH